MDHFGPFIRRTLSAQEQKGGLLIDKITAGTKLSVETANSIYEITIINGNEIMLMGGVVAEDESIRYPEPISAKFSGSTWGSSMIKKNWIGEGMRLEIHHDGKVLSTSPVKNVVVETADGQVFDLKWNNKKVV